MFIYNDEYTTPYTYYYIIFFVGFLMLYTQIFCIYIYDNNKYSLVKKQQQRQQNCM